MSTTTRDVIQDALEMIGVYAPGEIMTDADAERGLTCLNDMLDSWSNQSLACYANLEQSATLIVGQQSYTIGAGGNFNMVRPLAITVGPGAARIRDSNGNDYDVEVVTQDRWNIIGAKYTTSNIPTTLFYDPQYPLGIINLFPIPNISYTLFWDSRLQLGDLAALTTNVILPPGYSRALKSNLAVELFPYFKADGAQLNPLVLSKAMLSFGDIKRTNLKEVIAAFDPEIVSRATPSYNVYSDSMSGNRG